MSLYPGFARPRNLAQASEILAGFSGVVIIAGGQELMPHINYGALQPEIYVDIGGLPELKGIRAEEPDSVSIGALTVHREIQTDPLIAERLPLLALSARQIGGGRQVHNRGTIGGNIVAMHPLYDILPSLLALEAEVEFVKGGEQHRVSLAEALKDTRTGFGSEAILSRIFVRTPATGTGYGYEKLKTSGGAYGSANAAALATLRDGRLATLRIVIGAVADRLIDASQALSSFVGQPWSDALANRIGQQCAALVAEPLSDHQGDGEWRRAMAGVVARRALAAAVARAQGSKE